MQLEPIKAGAVRHLRSAHELVARQYQLWNEELLPQLAAQGIHFLRRREWNDVQKAWIKAFFLKEIMPVITKTRFRR